MAIGYLFIYKAACPSVCLVLHLSLTAAKNHIKNFSDRPFGPHYCSSSNASLTAPSNLHYYSMYLK